VDILIYPEFGEALGGKDAPHQYSIDVISSVSWAWVFSRILWRETSSFSAFVVSIHFRFVRETALIFQGR